MITLTVTKLRDRIYKFNENGPDMNVDAFLVIGKNKGILIDGLMDAKGVLKEARKLMTKRKKQTVALTILVVVVLMFIWGNSLVPGETSGEISDGVTAFIARVLGIESETMGHYVRKAAHFTEYAVLGITISVLLLWIGERGKDYFMPLGLCMLACPFIDETIQLFTPDRGAMISDMWIDIGGFALGSVIVLLINRTVHAKRNKRKLKDLAR